MIYSGRTKNLIDPVLQRFAKETGTKISIRYGESPDLALLVDQEGTRTRADVFISQNPSAMAFLATKRRLAGLPGNLLDLVPAQFRSQTGEWVGVTGRVRVLVYNSDLVKRDELPKSVFDLTGPAYKNKVAVAPNNGSFQDFVTAMRELRGDADTQAWLRGMAANGAKTYANNTAIVQAVGRGEVPMGLVNHYYNLRAKAEDPGVKSENYYFPDGDLGGLVLESGVALLQGSKRSAEGEKFIRYLLSEETQTYFAAEGQEYPLVAGVAAPSGLPPLGSLKAPRLDLTKVGGELRRTKELIDDSGLAR